MDERTNTVHHGEGGEEGEFYREGRRGARQGRTLAALTLKALLHAVRREEATVHYAERGRVRGSLRATRERTGLLNNETVKQTLPNVTYEAVPVTTCSSSMTPVAASSASVTRTYVRTSTAGGATEKRLVRARG